MKRCIKEVLVLIRNFFGLQDYKEHNDDTTVHFEVIMSEENLLMAKQEGLLQKFKLTTKISTSNMHLFDSNGTIKKYETPEQSMKSDLVVKIKLISRYITISLYLHFFFSLYSSGGVLSFET